MKVLPCDYMISYFLFLLGGINLDDPFGIYDTRHGSLELEGTLQPEYCNHRDCIDNATIQIKITPEKDYLGLEVSLSSTFKSKFRLLWLPFIMRNSMFYIISNKIIFRTNA